MVLTSSIVILSHFNKEICRMLVGVGEASFISLAAPFIDDNAPVAQVSLFLSKTAWLAVFYMCIPTGIAVGYVYGGLVSYLSSANSVVFLEESFLWVYCDLDAGHWKSFHTMPLIGIGPNFSSPRESQAILMLPFAILGFVIKPLQLKGFTSTGKEKLASVDMAVPEAEGYIAYNFVIGAYSYWGPKAGYDIYHMHSPSSFQNNADLLFGAVTIVCGIFGTLAGGYILDKINSTISNAFKLLSGASFLGAAFCFSAFCNKNLYAFLVLFAVGELMVFATQAPVNYICLHCVKPSLRPLSMAMSTVSIHIFGDVPSSPLVGAIQQRGAWTCPYTCVTFRSVNESRLTRYLILTRPVMHKDKINNWRATALILTSVIFIAAAVWFIGIFLHSVDRFNEESEHKRVERSNQMPLLDGDRTEATETA
ncbi:hypothetical protein ACLOJK_036140 [Asimina triloba]